MRKKKPNLKVAIIVGVCLFVGISVVVINAHDMQTISRVKFSNQNIVISQGNTGFSNTDVGFNNAGNLSNQGVGGSNVGNLNNVGGHVGNQNVGLNNNGQLNNTGGNFNNAGEYGNSGNFGNTNAGFENQGGFSNSGGSFSNESGGFYTQSGGFGGNSEVGFVNQDYRTNSNRYSYKDIDWSTWKSNFVNRILDDSMYIKSLDNYGVGTWFYYSFNVTDAGEIKDVTVFSFYLSEEDKKAIRDLIRSYVRTPITIFPKDSKRKKAKVKAIMLLGDTESKSNASNFRDVEKIKVDY